jgi:hypothetical protein
MLAGDSHGCEAACLGALKSLCERLHHGWVSRREGASILEGDLKAQPSTHEQREGLLLARKCHVGGRRLRRRAFVGGSITKRLLSSHGAEGTQERVWT